MNTIHVFRDAQTSTQMQPTGLWSTLAGDASVRRVVRPALASLFVLAACATETQEFAAGDARLGGGAGVSAAGTSGAPPEIGGEGAGTAGGVGAGTSEAGGSGGSGGTSAAGALGGVGGGCAAGSGGKATAGSAGEGGGTSMCGTGGPVSNFNANVTNFDDELRAEIMLNNAGSIVVPVCQLTARYYFTAEAPQVTVQAQALDKWPPTLSFGTANVSASVKKLPTPTATATHYVEISFTDSTTTKLAQYNWVRVRIQVSPQQTQQTDDYSFAGAGEHVASSLITVYRSGNLIWGTEPQ